MQSTDVGRCTSDKPELALADREGALLWADGQVELWGVGEEGGHDRLGYPSTRLSGRGNSEVRPGEERPGLKRLECPIPRAGGDADSQGLVKQGGAESPVKAERRRGEVP